MGNREQTIRSAIDQLGREAGQVTACSSFFYSEPWGFRSEHAFCNCCIALRTSLSPIDLLHYTQYIERTHGRAHKSTDGTYHDRTLDIDLILAYDDEGREIRLSSDKLTLPHPLWTKRDFVKKPLAEIR